MASFCKGWQTSMMLVMVLFFGTASYGSADQELNTWLAKFREEARGKGISVVTLDSTLKDVKLLKRVVELDRSQPEFKRTFSDYLQRVVPESRVKRGRQRYRENRSMLEKIGSHYGVEPQVIVALWGIETDFGRIIGKTPVVSALVTLAYDTRRGDYFRRELLDLLHLVDDGSIPLDRLHGSWAGAMGQVQFMPSSFRQYAVDFTGDGLSDIWADRYDAWASAANYLSKAGWQGGEGWGIQVQIPAGFNEDLAGLKTRKTLARWRDLGVQGIVGADTKKASLVLPEGPGGPAYLVFDNFRVIMKWNRSTSFALSVGHLADAIGADG